MIEWEEACLRATSLEYIFQHHQALMGSLVTVRAYLLVDIGHEREGSALRDGIEFDTVLIDATDDDDKRLEELLDLSYRPKHILSVQDDQFFERLSHAAPDQGWLDTGFLYGNSVVMTGTLARSSITELSLGLAPPIETILLKHSIEDGKERTVFF